MLLEEQLGDTRKAIVENHLPYVFQQKVTWFPLAGQHLLLMQMSQYDEAQLCRSPTPTAAVDTIHRFILQQPILARCSATATLRWTAAADAVPFAARSIIARPSILGTLAGIRLVRRFAVPGASVYFAIAWEVTSLDRYIGIIRNAYVKPTMSLFDYLGRNRSRSSYRLLQRERQRTPQVETSSIEADSLMLPPQSVLERAKEWSVKSRIAHYLNGLFFLQLPLKPLPQQLVWLIW